MPHNRAHIRLNTTAEASAFVAQINTDGTTDKYIIEDFNSAQRSARKCSFSSWCNLRTE